MDELEVIVVSSGSSEDHKKKKIKDSNEEEEITESKNEDGEIKVQFRDLPREVYVNILQFLDVEDIVKISLLSKKYLRVTKQEEVWEPRYNKWIMPRDDGRAKDREFYIKKYNEHLITVHNNELAAEDQRNIERRNRLIDNLDLA